MSLYHPDRSSKDHTVGIVIDSLAAQLPPVDHVPGWEVATVLVTVKAYPAIARQTGESVCVAGIRLDRGRAEWIRLFPVGFRALPSEGKFEKYQVIRLRVRRGNTDRRPESYKPDLSSIILGPKVPTNDNWRRRWELLDDVVGATTTCALMRGSKANGQDAPSLGLIKPTVRDVIVRDNPSYRPDRAENPQIDVDLFGVETELLEATPFQVYYLYECQSPGCGGHEQSIIDWESGQLARRNMSMGVHVARTLQRKRFLDELCSPTRDTYFYVGNQHKYPSSYMVLGVFWPPERSRPAATLTL